MVLQKNARRYREGMGIKMSFIQFWQTLCRYGLTAREDWVALKPYLDSGDRPTHLATTTDAQMIKKDFVRTMLQNGRVYSVRSRMPAILDVGGLGSAGDENDGGPPAVRMIVFEVLDVNPGGKVTAERKEYDEFFLPISVQMWTASSAYDDPEAPPQSVRLRPQGLPIICDGSGLATMPQFTSSLHQWGRRRRCLEGGGVEILDPKHWNSLIPLVWEPARTPAFYLLDKLRRLGRPDG